MSPLQALQNLLSEFKNRGVIIGGIAASLLGTPRYTSDLDAVILLNFEDLPHVITEAKKQGIEPRIADPIPFARKNRVLLLRYEATGIDIDKKRHFQNQDLNQILALHASEWFMGRNYYVHTLVVYRHR